VVQQSHELEAALEEAQAAREALELANQDLEARYVQRTSG
jgi:hypothetical protein